MAPQKKKKAEPKFYEVEKVVGKRTENKVVEYEVKWKGYKETSWEPGKNLKYTDLIEEYEKTVKEKDSLVTPGKKRSSGIDTKNLTDTASDSSGAVFDEVAAPPLTKRPRTSSANSKESKLSAEKNKKKKVAAVILDNNGSTDVVENGKVALSNAVVTPVRASRSRAKSVEAKEVKPTAGKKKPAPPKSPSKAMMLPSSSTPFTKAAAASAKKGPTNKMKPLENEIWRHGDRSPTTTWKSDVNREDVWPQGWGQLTTVGMEQHVVLGKKLRQRYIKEQKLVSETYKNHEIYVRSTDVNRTLVSAISNLIGFYGETAEAGRDFPENDWPKGYIPIAVHTVDTSNDHIGNPDCNCPRRMRVMELWKDTPEYKKLLEEKGWLFDNLTKLCDETINVENFWVVADTLYIENLWRNRLPITFPQWADDKMLEEINQINWLLESWENGRMMPLKGVDFSLELPKMRGGGLLWSIIAQMQEKIACMKLVEAGANHTSLSAECKWFDRLKYYVFSVHDTTIAGLFATLGFNKTNYDTEGYPHYSACVTVELWQAKDKEYYTKVLYWVPGNETEIKDMTKDIVGCEKGCSLQEFAKRSMPYKAEPSQEEYCQNTDLGLTILPKDPISSAERAESFGKFTIIALLTMLIAFKLT